MGLEVMHHPVSAMANIGTACGLSGRLPSGGRWPNCAAWCDRPYRSPASGEIKVLGDDLELARLHTTKRSGIVLNRDTAPATSVAAANAILDRGYGKAVNGGRTTCERV
jgi:hypothetical protein